ncbi:hypothetical protein HanPSC8_Chr03g0087831 [Helianthus annuus]|nr:hypothetical protein HanPSC8_Chr03g0087831 [Helianthus annuus]
MPPLSPSSTTTYIYIQLSVSISFFQDFNKPFKDFTFLSFLTQTQKQKHKKIDFFFELV